MKLGTNLRNWGPGSDPETLVACAEAADGSSLDTVWVNERLSLPPDSGWSPADGGRYLDAFLALAYVASRTSRIRLGTGVINAPYRRIFQLIKQVSSLQDLSGGRLRLGVGAGWHEEEFTALGIDFKMRGRETSEALVSLSDAFEAGTVKLNGVEMPLLPAPKRPPVYVGGSVDNALRRAVLFGDGWIAAGVAPEDIAPRIERLQEIARDLGARKPYVIAMKTLPLEDISSAVGIARAYAEVGVDEFVHADGYAGVDAYKDRIDLLEKHIAPAVTA